MGSLAHPNTFNKRLARPQMVGSLTGDLGVIALNLQHALKRTDIVVWADRSAEVYFIAVEHCPEVGGDALIGTYGPAAHVSDIEADLGAMRREIVSSAILD